MYDDIPLILEREAGAPDYISAIAVGFGMMPVEDKSASEKAGHPVFVDREFFSARVPGDKNTHSLRFATKKDREMFPKAYAAFKQRDTVPVQGLPIEQWPQITRGQAMTFRAAGIQTVEALAEVHDGNIDKIGMSARELRAKARAFRDLAAETAAAQKIAAENEALKLQMSDMQRQINELASLAQEQKRGPGRPRKEAEAA